MTNRFQKLAVATTATTYLLILVGALVRAAGAGMGCPDWPRCYGRWVPPTDVSQIPPSLASTFNAQLTWIEYLNRLLGTTTGLLVFATLVVAVLRYRHAPRVLWSSVGAFVGVGTAGWLGKLVVQTHLSPGLITTHMFVALATVSALLYATVSASSPDGAPHEEVSDARRRLGMQALAAAGVLMVQIGLGTRVRAALEGVAAARPELPRGAWLAQIGATDAVHRTGSLVVLALCVLVALSAFRRVEVDRGVRTAAGAVAVLAVAQVLAGVGLAYVALPPMLQVAHVTLASLLLGALMLVAMFAFRPAASAGTQGGIDAQGRAPAVGRA
jgi:cytochrome c oxidase assembly protein subunit 15